MELTGLSGVSAWLVYSKVVFSFMFLRRFNAEHDDQISLLCEIKDAEKNNDISELKRLVSMVDLEKFKVVYYSLPEIVKIFKESSDEQKKSMLIEGFTICALSNEEMLRLLAVHKDANGIFYSAHNIKNIASEELIPLCLETCLAASKLNCDFSLMTAEELELVEKHRVSIHDEANEILSKNPDIPTGELLSIAVKKAFSRIKELIT